MANFVFNVAKGRVAELVNRVDTNDPANSALVLVLINTNQTDTVLKRLDTLADIEAATGTNELTSGTNANYARIVVTDAGLATFTVDDVNDKITCTLADQTWTALGAGTNPTDLVICYDSDTTGGADSAIIPLTCHDFAVTPDGNDVVADFGATFYEAS